MAAHPFAYCFNGTYAANSTFDRNLQRLLASLAVNSSHNDYYHATMGESPDQVDGWVQCRGDIDKEVCQICATDVTSQIVKFCPNNRAALISSPGCIMYYYGNNFSIPNWIKTFSMPSAGAIANPPTVQAAAVVLLRSLPPWPSSTLPAGCSGATNSGGLLFRIPLPLLLLCLIKHGLPLFRFSNLSTCYNVTIYGTVECPRFLSPDTCKSCLQEAIARMIQNVSDTQGAALYNKAVCYIRYEAFPFFAPLLPTIALSSAKYISSNCSAAALANLTGTPYHRNMKALLDSLIENGPLTGFFSQTVGQSGDQVYGEVMCRGDIPGDVCWNCTAQASAKILQLFPNSKTAIIWLDYCQLRYSDVSLRGVVDVSDKACQSDPENAPSPKIFEKTLRDLIDYLASNVSQGSSGGLMFATGTATFSKSQRNIYAFVQCNRDIPADQCGWCLQNAFSDISGCSKEKQGARIFKGSCRLSYGLQNFLLGQPMLVLPGKQNHKPWWVFLIISVISLVLLAAACALCLLRIRKQRLDKLKYNIEADDNDGNATEKDANYDLPQISLRAIQDATNNFSEANKLGEGGFGPVYKGKLPDGQEVAVKRLATASGQGVREFRNEVKLIAKLQHTNLVRLIGCCLEKGEKILVYEYMSNKSLDYFLKDPEHSLLLDWEGRFNIIMGIARGILYLHQDSRLNVVHRDLKAGNILLDEQMNPKISDFGMARTFTGVHGQATTSVVVGTYGYMAPEYALDGMFSTKSDVYSFGILLLEIIGGQLNSKFQLCHPDQNLISHAWRLWSEGNVSEFIDPTLRSTSSVNEMERCVNIGLLCIQEDAATRPTMSTVVLMLGNNSLALPLPKAPAYSQIISTAAQSSSQLSSDFPIDSPTPR